MHRYTALIDGEAGAYGVSFPDLPGCVAMGATVDAAMLGAAEALWEFNADVTANGAAMPAPSPPERLRADPEVAKALVEGAILASVPLVRETARSVKANLSLNAGVLAAIEGGKPVGAGFVFEYARRPVPGRWAPCVNDVTDIPRRHASIGTPRSIEPHGAGAPGAAQLGRSLRSRPA